MRPLLLLFFGGLVTGAFLVVQDEILTLAIYCQGCLYPYPFIGSFTPYNAEIIADVGIVAGILLFLFGFMWIVVVQVARKASEQDGLSTTS